MNLKARVAVVALIGSACTVGLFACGGGGGEGGSGGHVLPGSSSKGSSTSRSSVSTSTSASSSASAASSSGSSSSGNCVATPVTEQDFLNACPAPATCNAYTMPSGTLLHADGSRPALP